MVTNKMNTSFVLRLILDFYIFAVISVIEGELSGIMDVFDMVFLFERVAAMLKR